MRRTWLPPCLYHRTDELYVPDIWQWLQIERGPFHQYVTAVLVETTTLQQSAIFKIRKHLKRTVKYSNDSPCKVVCFF